MKTFWAIIAAYVLVLAAVGYGWMLNIMTLLGMSLETLTVEFVLRVVGVPFVPLGVIMGYFV